MIWAILAQQNFNNMVSGGIYLQPHVLMEPKDVELEVLHTYENWGPTAEE